MKKLQTFCLPYLSIFTLLAGAIYQLHRQGRLWICSCGRVDLWTGDTFSSNNSQHISDPYSFSHFQHGLVFFIVIDRLLPKLKFAWKLFIAVAIESGWEVLENSELIINRYRSVTASLGYHGDTIINSVSDIMFCTLGFFAARYLGVWKTALIFIIIEITMIFWIKDSLLLNILMLIYPVPAIKAWQVGQ